MIEISIYFRNKLGLRSNVLTDEVVHSHYFMTAVKSRFSCLRQRNVWIHATQATKL